MIESFSLDDSQYHDPLFSHDNRSWDKIGRPALYIFSFVAVSTFIPAAIKKKRHYNLLSTGADNLLQVAGIQNALDATPLPEGKAVPKCSGEDAARIREIFEKTDDLGRQMSDFLPWKLAKTTFHLTTLGNLLWDHKVHPFEFLKQAPQDRLCSIFRSGNPLKINGVLSGIKRGMERERNTLLLYLRAFAEDMGKKDPQKVRQLIQVGFERTDWRPLVYYLFDIKL